MRRLLLALCPPPQAVYVVLREAEHRSTAPIQYWNFPGAKTLVPRQKRCVEALQIVNDKLDGLIAKCKKLVEEEDEEFVEEFLSEADPSILHFLLAQGERLSVHSEAKGVKWLYNGCR